MSQGAVRETSLAHASERLISWFRIVGGVVGIVLTVTDQVVHPPLEEVVEVTSLGLLAVLGVVSLRWLRTAPDTAALRRWMRWTYALDALVLLAQAPLHAFVALEAPSPALLVPLLGAVRFGYRGALGGTAGVAVAYLVRGALAVGVYGLPFGVDPAVVTVLIAGIVGMITAHLYETAAAGRLAADAATAAAEEARRVAEHEHDRAAAVHAVLAGGVGGSVLDVGQRLVDTVLQVTGASAVQLTLELEGAGPRVDVGAGDMADAGTSTAVPVRHGEVALGTLVVGDPSRLEGDLEEFATQVGLAVHAARLLDEEAELAARHRALDLLRTDFVALTSHELRTPVAAIVGAAETLRDHAATLDPAQEQELHELVLRQANRLRTLVEDLLTVGRSDAGTLDYRPTYVHVADLVAEVLHELGRMPEVRGDDGVKVWLDPDRGRQVLLNLLDNAFVHGAEPVVVDWDVTESHALLSVTDAGTGIPDDHHEAVFERFVQLGSITNHSRGTGLGLGISRDLVRAMGGDVRIDADAPTTRFVVELPTEPIGAVSV